MLTKPQVTASYAELADLLKRSVSTVRADRVRRPDSLPPACVPPGSSRPIWIVEDVLSWLRQHRESQSRTQSHHAK